MHWGMTDPDRTPAGDRRLLRSAGRRRAPSDRGAAPRRRRRARVAGGRDAGGARGVRRLGRGHRRVPLQRRAAPRRALRRARRAVPGWPRCSGREEETQELLDGYDDFVHPRIVPGYDVAWRFADLARRARRDRAAGVPSRGRRRRGRAGCATARRCAVLDDGRVLLTGAVLRHLRAAACRGRARRGRAPARVALERRRADRAVQPPALLGGAARAPRRLGDRRRDRARRRRPLQAHQRHARPPESATSCCARSRAGSRTRPARAT